MKLKDGVNKMKYYISFKSLPLFYRKERSGLKNNTVRYIDNPKEG